MTRAEAPRSRWLTIEAMLLVVLGIGAVVLPLAAGLAAAIVFGWVLIVAGAVGVISAVQGHVHAHRTLSLISALIALVVGGVLLAFPLLGAAGLVWLVGLYLFLDGFALVGLAMDHRRRTTPRWGWQLASGVVDLVLAVFILFLGLAASALLLGFVVGVDLIVAGVALLSLHGWRRQPGLGAPV